MAIFGRMAPRGATSFIPEGQDLAAMSMGPSLVSPQKPQVPSPRRGIFGRAAAFFTPERLRMIGAGLRQMDGGSELDDFLANQLQQQQQAEVLGMQVRGQKLEEAQSERERMQREAALAALPENLRPLAPLLTNEGITSAVMPPEWQPIPQNELPSGARFGQRNTRTGERDLEWTPAGDAAGRAPPAGYRFTPDGNLEAIPGGPADVRATAEGRSRAAQMDSSVRSLTNAIEAIDRAQPLVTGGNTGFLGQVTRGLGGTGGYDLNQALEPVRAILSFETLAEMRRNSQTGGALGSIAVRELELLGNTMSSLDTAQSEGQLRSSLQQVRSQLSRTLQAVAAARQELDGGGSQQMPAASAETGGGNVVRYDAQGNRIP